MSDSIPEVVDRYFAALNNRESASLVALFTPDAVVVDEGRTWRGATEIHTWVDDVAFRFQYTAEVLGVKATGDGKYVARVRLQGNFPGGRVELRASFDVDGDGIRRLENAA